MSEAEIYYTAPSDEIFEEVKQACITIWQRYDNRFGYVDEKVGKLKPMRNIRDNFMHMIAMFDLPNQTKLASMISKKARWEVDVRMESGGQPSWANPFKE